MSGEITLQGRVLAVGGLKEKLLAAKQHGIKTVIVPQENFDDIQEILKEANLGDLQLVYASTMDEVLKTALVKNPFSHKPSKQADNEDKPAKKKSIKKKNSIQK